MRSLADFRRAVKVGAVFEVTNHFYPELSGRRQVLKAQTKNLCLTFPEGHPRAGAGKGSWLDIPSAGDCVFEEGALTIMFPGDGPFVTIREVTA